MSKFRTLIQDKKILSWALYDWANSVFATTVIAGFFPVFFKQYWSSDADAVVSTAQLGFANSVATAVFLFGAPILGALADGGGTRKKFLAAFTLLGALLTAGLWFVGEGEWLAAAWVYGISTICFWGAIVFYDSLITAVSPFDRYDEVSSFGFALGYLGGGILFAINVAMTLSPATFGLSNPSEAVRVSFISVAVWWIVFSLPLFWVVKEQPRVSAGGSTVLIGLKALVGTLKSYREYRPLLVFLLAYFFYIDGVHTIIRMAVDYGMSIGFPSDSLIIALLITQFIGFPAAIVFGIGARRFGPKNALYVGVAIYVAVTVYAYFMTSVLEFYILAASVGLVQGGVQAVSRSLYARFVPPTRSGEFFGFFNMLGRFSALIGPSLVAVTGLLTGSSRLGILSVIVLFVVGLVLLGFVRTPDRDTQLANAT